MVDECHRYVAGKVAGLLLLALTAVSSPLLAQERDVLLSGVVFSRQAQEVFVPLTNNWQARISKMLPEGTAVKKGDVVVEFDGSEVARQLEQQQVARRTEQAKTERDIASLEKALLEAEFLVKQTTVALELATLKADIPEGLLGGLEHAENKLNEEKAIKAVEDAKEQLRDKQLNITERQRAAELDARKSKNQLEFWEQMLESFAVKAQQEGFIIYGKHPWTRTKFQEGDTVQTSFRVAQIADTADLAVYVWINSVDRPHIKAGTAVSVKFDALPGRVLNGALESISDSGSKRPEWGTALYYKAIVLFESPNQPDLLPGMSVRVEPRS